MQEKTYPRGTKLQVYLPAFHPRGNRGLVEKLGWLRWLGVDGVVTQPVNKYRRSSWDGVYSPLDHMEVDEEFGGKAGVVAVNRALADAGITPIGDLVLLHADEQSELVRRVFRDPARWSPWFRLSDEPEVFEKWDRMTNIPGFDPRLWEAMLQMARASVFFPDQWQFNAANPEVVTYLCDVGEFMVRELEYGALRLDAIGHLTATKLLTASGHHEAAGLAVAEELRRRLSPLATKMGHRPYTIGEAGGPDRGTSAWIMDGRCDMVYDVDWWATLVRSLDVGNWIPLRRHWALERPVAGEKLRYLGSHDERQGRYRIDKKELIVEHGGDDGEFVCFDGNGLTVPVRNLVSSDQAFLLLAGLTILSKGVPLLYQNDVGGYRGDIHVREGDPREPNRCLFPWDAELTNAGWPHDATRPLDPEWEVRSVAQQMADPYSVMAAIRRFMHVRKLHPVVQFGSQVEMPTGTTRVEVLARIGAEGNPFLICANAADSHSAGYPNLSQWKGRRLRRLSHTGYGPDSPVLLWDPRTSRIGRRDHEIRLGPYALEVLEVI